MRKLWRVFTIVVVLAVVGGVIALLLQNRQITLRDAKLQELRVDEMATHVSALKKSISQVGPKEPVSVPVQQGKGNVSGVPIPDEADLLKKDDRPTALQESSDEFDRKLDEEFMQKPETKVLRPQIKVRITVINDKEVTIAIVPVVYGGKYLAISRVRADEYCYIVGAGVKKTVERYECSIWEKPATASLMKISVGGQTFLVYGDDLVEGYLAMLEDQGGDIHIGFMMPPPSISPLVLKN